MSKVYSSKEIISMMNKVKKKICKDLKLKDYDYSYYYIGIFEGMIKFRGEMKEILNEKNNK